MGSIDLGVCEVCAFIQNSAFDQGDIDYTKPYEDSQAASPTFRAFAIETARMLDERFSLQNKRIFEVGCGKAEWLALVCRDLNSHGLAIDPAYVPGRAEAADEARLEVIVDFFDQSKTDLTGDLVVCRHTLEHIRDARSFSGLLYASAARTPESGLFVEVPECERILTEGAYWDVYYEHCSYFTRPSLHRMLEGVGFRDVRIDLGYADQYLLATARTMGPTRPIGSVDEILHLADTFANATSEETARWRELLDDVQDRGRPAVIWGASSKAVGFMAAIDRSIVAAVDINPAKHGSFLPGTGTPVVAPEELEQVDPGIVVIMNPIYRDEITQRIRVLGVDAAIVALGAD